MMRPLPFRRLITQRPGRRLLRERARRTQAANPQPAEIPPAQATPSDRG